MAVIAELTALEQAVQAENTALGDLGGTVTESVSLGFSQTGTNPDGGTWTATTSIAVEVEITQSGNGPEAPSKVEGK